MQFKTNIRYFQPKTTLKRATLHVSLAYLIQTRKVLYHFDYKWLTAFNK